MTRPDDEPADEDTEKNRRAKIGRNIDVRGRFVPEKVCDGARRHSLREHEQH
jgi:hypothetical protein